MILEFLRRDQVLRLKYIRTALLSPTKQSNGLTLDEHRYRFQESESLISRLEVRALETHNDLSLSRKNLFPLYYLSRNDLSNLKTSSPKRPPKASLSLETTSLSRNDHSLSLSLSLFSKRRLSLETTSISRNYLSLLLSYSYVLQSDGTLQCHAQNCLSDLSSSSGRLHPFSTEKQKQNQHHPHSFTASPSPQPLPLPSPPLCASLSTSLSSTTGKCLSLPATPLPFTFTPPLSPQEADQIVALQHVLDVRAKKECRPLEEQEQRENVHERDALSVQDDCCGQVEDMMKHIKRDSVAGKKRAEVGAKEGR